MGRTTLAVTLKREAGANGEQVIRIRITKDRQARFWPMNLSVLEKQFNAEGNAQGQNWIRRNHHDYKTYNQRILSAWRQAEQAVAWFEKRDRSFSAADVRDYLTRGGQPDRVLAYFARHQADRLAAAGSYLSKIRTAGGYLDTLKVLRAYVRYAERLPADLPDDAVDRSGWLLSSLEKADVLKLKGWLEQHYAVNSVTSYLRNLRHVLYVAAEEGLVSYEQFPMRKIPLTIERKRVERLTDDEIETLATADAPSKHRGGHPSVTDPIHVRPLALAMYHGHGARVGDAIGWRMENYVIEGDQHRLRYKTGKNRKEMSVLLNAEAVAIFAPYRLRSDGGLKQPAQFLFPYLPDNYDKLTATEKVVVQKNATNRVRGQMRRLAERMGLGKHLTPHVMRHSLADKLRREGVAPEVRQMVLAHSNFQTTRDYESQFDALAVDAVAMLTERRSKPATGQHSVNNVDESGVEKPVNNEP